MKARQKTTKLLVHASSNSNRCALNHTLNGDLRVPVFEQTGRFPVQLGYPQSNVRSNSPTRLDKRSLQHRCTPLLCADDRKSPATQCHPGAGYAPIDLARAQCIDSNYSLNLDFPIRVERHPSRANAASNFGSSIILRAVVDYFNLHLVRARDPAAARSTAFPPNILLADRTSESLPTRMDAVPRLSTDGSPPGGLRVPDGMRSF